jgi:uncharacterized protein (TIGR03437 family)
MGQNATTWIRRGLAVAFAFCTSVLAAQNPEWRRAGTAVIDFKLASPAAGAVERVWYSAGGDRLFARTQSGRIYETIDYENWKLAGPDAQPAGTTEYSRAVSRPEPAARTRAAGAAASARVYAFGEAVYRSSDEGSNWRNVSDFQGESILGGGFQDLAVSPRDPDEVTVANRFGIWRSLDAGLTWSGLNETLENLPVRRLYQAGTRLRIGLDGGSEAVWLPGQQGAWLPAAGEFGRREMAARSTLSNLVGARVSAVADSGDFLYAGSDGARIWSSADRGRTWRFQLLGEGGLSVSAVFAAPDEPRVALAAVGSRVFRTFNGGLFWDDITANLAPAGGEVRGLAADVSSGAVYVAARNGVFLTYLDLRGASPATAWTKLGGLAADAQAWDVKLGEGGHQLYVALDGAGVFAGLAPHRFRDPRVVNAADQSTRPASPGSLLTVVGASVGSARVGSVEAPVLGVSGGESQIQVPFEVNPGAAGISLALESGRRDMPLPVAAASPAIFLDRDGSPMLLDADRGVLLEPGTAARAGSRLQILATGLGRVTPQWPSGTPAPADNTPRVVAPVRVFVDRVPVEVTRATLAPGFVGFYLVEVVLPEAVNNGPAELYIEVAGQSSGRVSVPLVQ